MGDALQNAVLPAVTILVTSLGGWIIGMRNAMINTLGDDYVTFAEANGLRGRTVAIRYAARNAILPNLTGFGLALGGVVGGSVLVEQVFGYPGLSIADGSVLPGPVGPNPSLTIAAVADRSAEWMLDNWSGGA